MILGKKTECLYGQNYIEEKLLDKTFKIGANTFFQINPESAENIFQYVKDFIKKDLYKTINFRCLCRNFDIWDLCL